MKRIFCYSQYALSLRLLICLGTCLYAQKVYAQTVTTLHTFSGGPNGRYPNSGLILAKDGNLYGTTTQGGSAKDYGTIFKLTPAGAFSRIWTFAGGTDGAHPIAGLIQGADGNLYGTASSFGSKKWGEVFRITTGGALTPLYGFAGGIDGYSLRARLTRLSDGSLYGVTTQGGSSSQSLGTVFRITPEGVHTVLQSFGWLGGNSPLGGLILATDGNLYGTTSKGAPCSTIFRVSRAGTFTTIFEFNTASMPGNLQDDLIQASDGNLYGSTRGPGTSSIFQITTAGKYTTLWTFKDSKDGLSPNSNLIQARDGDLYGTTCTGGGYGYGTIFKITTTGKLTTLWHFTGGPDGQNPQAGLVQAADGSFYGTTTGSAAQNGVGTAFQFSPGTGSGNNPPPPKLVLTKATTSDAQSVTVTYTISKAIVTQPLRFDFYRTQGPIKDNTSLKLASQTIDPITDPADLTIGTHTIRMASGISLPPVPTTRVATANGIVTTPGKQYVVVEANGNGSLSEDPTSVNSIYFHKILIAGIAHGYSFNNSDTTAWMQAMGKDLLYNCGFDDVAYCYWLDSSTVAKPGLATAAGHSMYDAVVKAAKNKLVHPGDVIDIHFFGHSRGTVVVAQALNDMVLRPSTVWLGSYVEVTFLDIHPANVAADELLSFSNNSAGITALQEVEAFQKKAADPEINLTKVSNIKSIDIWSQHTPAWKFSGISSQWSEAILNLWGQDQTTNHLLLNLRPIWNDLTNHIYTVSGSTLFVGHSEVHEFYRLFQIDQGLVH